LDRFAARPAPGLYRLDPKPFAHDQGEAGLLALRAVLAAVGGAVHLPDVERAERLRERLALGAPLRATLSRTVIEARHHGIWLRREARNLPEAIVDGAIEWDGRYRITAGKGPVRIGPLGQEPAKTVEEQPAGFPARMARLARASEPAVQSPGGERHAANGREACDAGLATVPVVASHARFLPGFDLPLAAALRRLVGAPPLPDTPWKKHIDA
jgi:tRNA(Ile)-lysidine synthase